MIGKIYTAVFPYYDNRTNRNAFKSRPVLIIGGPKNNDYTILPVSTVSRKENLDPEYDFEIDSRVYPELHLRRTSYVRVHKQSTVHAAALKNEISDLKSDYEDAWLQIMILLDSFNKAIQDNALK